MSSEWQTVTLAEEVDLLTGFPFRSADYSDDQTQPRLVRGDNVIQGKLRWDGAKHWPATKTGQLRDYALTEGDVVVAMDRPWIEAGLKFARITSYDLPCYLVQRVARLRAGQRLDQRFLAFIIASADFTDHVLAVQTGTSIPHISSSQIKEFAFSLPPIVEQRAIARVLGALEDKIDSNRRMNLTLEEMAAALFRSWFVDFDPVVRKSGGVPMIGKTAAAYFQSLEISFPDSFEDSELGPIPKGWRVGTIEELARYVNGRPFTKGASGSGRMVIRIAELNSGPGGSTVYNDVIAEPENVAQPGDLLFAWSGSLDVYRWFRDEALINQHIFKVVCDRYPQWFVHYALRETMPFFQDIAADKATTMGHIKRGHLSEAKLAIPPDDLIAETNRIIEPMYKTHLANDRESQTLAALRDTLLPKLLSGEVRVKGTSATIQDMEQMRGRE